MNTSDDSYDFVLKENLRSFKTLRIELLNHLFYHNSEIQILILNPSLPKQKAILLSI